MWKWRDRSILHELCAVSRLRVDGWVGLEQARDSLIQFNILIVYLPVYILSALYTDLYIYFILIYFGDDHSHVEGSTIVMLR